MEIQVFNKAIEFQGVLDNFNSFRFLSRYSNVGEFEIKAPLTLDTLKLLKRDNFILDQDNQGYIETVQLDITSEGEIITAKGKDLNGILGRRINWNTINFTGTAESFMRKLVNDNCIVTDSNRIIHNLSLGALHGYTEPITKQDSYSNLLTLINEVAVPAELGFEISLNAKLKQFIFDVYKGIDKTVNQSSRPPTIFSREFENVLSQSYIDSLNNYCNTALICGEGEGVARVKTILGNITGLDRYEMYVDVSGVTSKVGDIVIPQADYIKLLQQNGKEKLAECYQINTFDSVVNTVVAKGYKLGDMVTIKEKEWGLVVNTRITEIETIHENTGKTVNVTFGNNVPTIFEKLERRN